MKKSISKIFLLSIAIIFAACEKSDAYFSQWEGEYVVKRTLAIAYNDGTTESIDYSFRELPLYIFQDNGLFVQTYGIGDPYMPGFDSDDHTLRVRTPQRISMQLQDSIEQGIENVDVSSKSQLVLFDGCVYTIYKGAMYSPNPIRVSKAKSDKLILENGSTFTVALTDASGMQIDVSMCNWEYSEIQKQNESYTWTADLHLQSTSQSGRVLPVLMRSKYVITKK